MVMLEPARLREAHLTGSYESKVRMVGWIGTAVCFVVLGLCFFLAANPGCFALYDTCT